MRQVQITAVVARIVDQVIDRAVATVVAGEHALRRLLLEEFRGRLVPCPVVHSERPVVHSERPVADSKRPIPTRLSMSSYWSQESTTHQRGCGGRFNMRCLNNHS
jgi:hypothetical protein